MPPGGVESTELAERSNLTSRERQIMDFLATGHTIPEIANQFGVARKTVRNNLGNIYVKLQVPRQSEAILLWLGHMPRQSPSAPLPVSLSS